MMWAGLTASRHEVCAAARGEERRGDPAVLHGGVGAVCEGEWPFLARSAAEDADDDESVSHGAHSNSERGL